MIVQDSASQLAIHDPGHDPRIPICRWLDNVVTRIGNVVCWSNAILIVVIIGNVLLRYGFHSGHPALEELQWHLYALVVMMGVSYAQVTNSHVRVDVIAAKLSETAMRLWEIFGILVFVFPFIFVVFWHSLDFFHESWRVGERSDAPIGLCCRWAIKAVIPVSFFLLFLAVLSRLLSNISALIRKPRRKLRQE